MSQALREDRATAGPAPLGARIAATFTAPARLAALIREQPRWIDVLLISTVVAVAAAAMIPGEVFLTAAEDAVNRRGAPVEITSPPEEIVRWGRYMAMLNALVGHPLVAFGLAGVLSIIFTVLPGGRNSFTQHLALTSHALLIVALGTLVSMVLGIATGAAVGDASLGALLPFVDPDSAMGEILALINPFTVWMLFVVGVGVSVLDPARSRRVTLGVLLGGYALLVLAIGLVT